MAKFCPECGNPVTDDIGKFCTTCGSKLPDSSIIQKDQLGSPSLPDIFPQIHTSIPDNTPKKRSTLEWIGIFCVGAILIIVLLAILSAVFITPTSTVTTQTSKTTENFYIPDQTTSAVFTTTNVPAPYIDPYPDALPLNSAFRIENTLDDLRYPYPGYYQPSLTSNDVSIQILRASLWDSYTVQNPTKYQPVGPLANKKFVIVAVNVMDTAGNDIITSPYPSNFELIYGGSRYLPTELDYPIQGSGNSYKSEKIARLEKTGGSLVYEVPSSLTLDRTYIQLIYSDDNEKNPVWRLQ